MGTITLTSVLEWLTMRPGSGEPKTALKLCFGLLDAVLAAAVADKPIPKNPCDGVKLSQILRGMSRAPSGCRPNTRYWHCLTVVHHRYRAAIWLGAGQSCRFDEVQAWETRPVASIRPTANFT